MSNKPSQKAPEGEPTASAPEAPVEAPKKKGPVVTDNTEETFPESEASPYDRKPKVKSEKRGRFLIETYE